MYVAGKKLPTPPVSLCHYRGAIPDRTFTLGDYGDIPLVTVGDSAFPRFSWLIECYEKSKIKEHLYFNKMLFSARVVSENTYGMLKGRRFLHN